MLIRTHNLLLRPPFAEDADEVFAGIADEGTVRMLARSPWPYLREHAERFCDRPLDPTAFQFLVALPGDSGAPVIGGIGLDESGRVPELGYWIAPGYRGRGYASEAVEAVLDAAAALGHRRIVAGHYLDNPASGAVLARAGFIETGEIRPTHCLGRGGDLVLARRYSADISARAWVREAA